MYILHIHSYPNIIRKTIHHAVNVTTTEAKLFAIRCEINQAIQISEAIYIIVITNVIHLVQCIFDFAIHLYQLQSITIVKDLRVFFNKHLMNSIEFWDCPSNTKWFHYTLVNKNTKKFNLSLIFPCKALWDFNKKEKCDNIIKNWQMTFQASNLKGNHFLELLDDEFHTIKLLYICYKLHSACISTTSGPIFTN